MVTVSIKAISFASNVNTNRKLTNQSVARLMSY